MRLSMDNKEHDTRYDTFYLASLVLVFAHSMVPWSGPSSILFFSTLSYYFVRFLVFVLLVQVLRHRCQREVHTHGGGLQENVTGGGRIQRE